MSKGKFGERGTAEKERPRQRSIGLQNVIVSWLPFHIYQDNMSLSGTQLEIQYIQS